MYTRLDFVDWPSGDEKPIADWNIDDQKFTKRTGMQLLPIEDFLGPAIAAGTLIKGFGPVLFLRYLEGPNRTIGIYADRSTDVQTALKLLSSALRLADGELVWQVSAGD